MNSCAQSFMVWAVIVFIGAYATTPYALFLFLLGWKCDGEKKKGS